MKGWKLRFLRADAITRGRGMKREGRWNRMGNEVRGRKRFSPLFIVNKGLCCCCCFFTPYSLDAIIVWGIFFSLSFSRSPAWSPVDLPDCFKILFYCSNRREPTKSRSRSKVYSFSSGRVLTGYLFKQIFSLIYLRGKNVWLMLLFN